MKANDILLILADLCILAASWVCGYVVGGRGVPVIEERHDTTVVEHFIDRPVEVVKWRDKERLVYVPVRDTVIKDSIVYVAVEREVKRYKDSTYEAQVSGIEPQLDWIKVFQKTVTITNTVQDVRRWTFGVTAGPGIVWNGSVHAGVGVVAGLQYRF